MTGACCHFCGCRPVEWHHCTGRIAPKCGYLDRALVVPLCKRHHDREHELLRRCGLEFLPPGGDPLGHRLARLLDFIGRCADHHRPFVFQPSTPYGDAVAGLHALLLEAVGAVDPRHDEAAG